MKKYIFQLLIVAILFANGLTYLIIHNDAHTDIIDKTETATPEIPVLNQEDASAKLSKYRLNNTLNPLHYDLYFDLTDTYFHGSARIDFTALASTKSFRLHGSQLFIKWIKLFDSNGTEIILSYVENINFEWFKIKLKNDKLKQGANYTLDLSYDGGYHRAGLVKTNYFENSVPKYQVFTHLEPTYARTVFPCFDEPALKATFNITIRHPRTHTAFSNTESYKSVQDTFKKNITYFKTTPIMSTYLVAFAAAEFQRVENERTGIIGRKGALWDLAYMLETSAKELKAFEKLLRLAYPMPKIDHIALTEGLPAAAMENWGLITYNENNIRCSAEENSYCNFTVPNLAGHELAHQWFGNIVTPRWWSDIWLNEGLASFFSYKIMDEINPSLFGLKSFAYRVRQYVFKSDCVEGAHPLVKDVETPREILFMFDPITYSKGGSIVFMLEHILGKSSFYDGLEIYLRNNSYKNVETKDLWNSLQAGVNKNKKDLLNQTVHQIGSSWMQAGFPLVNVTFNPSNFTAQLNQVRYLISEKELQNRDKASNFMVPINFLTDVANEEEAQDTSAKYLLTADGLTVHDLNASWVLVNNKQTGYYRVNYNKANWLAISKYLSNENIKNPIIDDVTKSMLIDDSFHLSSIGEVSYEIPLRLSRFLATETQYIPWESAYPHLNELYDKLSMSPAIENYKKYLNYLITNIYKSGTLGQILKNVEESKIKEIFLNLSLKTSNKKFTKDATTIFKDMILKNDAEYPGSDLISSFCASSKFGNSYSERLYNKYVNLTEGIYAESDIVPLVKGIACSLDETFIERLLEKFVNGTAFIYHQVPFVLSLSKINSKILYKFFITRFDDFKRVLDIKKLKAVFEIVAKKVATESQLMELQILAYSSGREDVFDHGLELGENNVKWNQKNADIYEWLENEVKNLNIL